MTTSATLLASLRTALRCIGAMVAILAATPIAVQAAADGASRVKPYAPVPSAGEAELIARYGFAPEHVGYLLFDIEAGQALATHLKHGLFMPASVAKVATTLAALEILGPDHRFETSLSVTGSIANGTLTGNLYLKGDGDPMLGLDDLMTIADALKTAGVRQVSGRFHYDESRLATPIRTDSGQSVDAPYNTGISALSVDFNRLMLNWRSSPDGTVAFATPALLSVQMAVEQADPLTEQGMGYRDDEGNEIWILSPRLPESGRTWLPVKRPGRRTAQLFRTLARMIGITLPPPESGAQPDTARLLHTHAGARLLTITESALEYSNNLMTELIGLSTTRRLTGAALPLAQSSARLADWWKAQLPDTRWLGFFLDNHSGLSSGARVSPAQMVDMMRFAAERRYGGRSYLSLLPISGWKGSLEEVLQVPTVSLRIWAKTGTMNYARGLAGYLFTEANRQMVFALFISDPARRRQFDADRERHLAASAAVAQSWTDRAKALEQAILEHWILTD